MAETILEKLQSKHNIFSAEVQDKLSNIIKQYKELKDDEKGHFNQVVKDIFKKSLNNLLDYKNSQKKWLTWLADSRVTFFLAILTITFLFVFFGYKLYKSLSERERKREEKKKMKQLKKKK